MRVLLTALLVLCATAARPGDFPLTPTPLARGPEGASLLAYLVGCALPPDQAAVLATADDPVRLEGGLGLAPGWRRRGLAPAEARLVSACILARLNRFGVPVEVSLRADAKAPAPSPALAASPDERAAFPLHEGAFFGDLFAPGAPAHVCQGRAAVEAPEKLRRARRVCALPSGAATPDGRPLSACGLVIVGRCETAGAAISPEAIHVYLRDPS